VRRLAPIGAAAFVATVALAVLLWPAADVADFATVKARWRPSDAYLLDRHGEILDRQRVDFGVRRFDWTPLEKISPALTAAIVDGEDRNFWRHRGVDWLAAVGAMRDQLIGGRRRGASTISMQVAALVDARARADIAGGALRRKFAQIRVARAIEAHWTKAQILEAYLNLLGFRGELQGIGAASQVLVGKAPSGLSLPESLVLAALLPAPGASQERVISRACARATARKVAIRCATLRTTAVGMLASASPTVPFQRLAPQLAGTLLKRPGERIQTTLNAQTQRLAGSVLSLHLAGLAARNVRDGAVLIVDNESGDVLAYVGSAGSQSRAREVDGVRAHRQAGSTLKPFLYELALERRYLTAASLLDDSSITLDTATGIYLPQDYDREFKGLVSVRTALASSLNVPAVRTLVLVGVQPFRDRLNRLGYSSITEDGEFYGYSLALGSAEVSLWEQVQAYRVLARKGRWSPLRLQPGKRAADVAMLPAGASFVIADILSDRAARSLSFGLDNHLNTSFWSAVKTGTSKDMRDNWCVGFSNRYTVGVWVGNFEGDSMRDVSGVTGAAPVWGQLMTALHVNTPSLPPSAPPGVTTQLARFTPAVEASRREWFLGQTEAHRVVAVTKEGGISKIASPANGMVIAFDPDIPPAQQRVPFTAQAAEEGAAFRLNGKLLGSADQTVLWSPSPGNHRLELVAASGRVADRIGFQVR